MNTRDEEAITLTKSTALGTALAASLGLALLTGCGGTDAAAVPDGWGTLDTKSVSVGYPQDDGYALQPAAERSKANAAVALKEEKGLRTGMVSVQLDFATGVDDAGEAAAAAGAGIGLGRPARTPGTCASRARRAPGKRAGSTTSSPRRARSRPP